MFGVAVACSLVAGFCKAAQSPTNAALSKQIGNAQATLISFVGGTVVLAVLSLLFGTGDISQVCSVPAWQLLGGVYGAFLVFTVTCATPVLGVALTLTTVMLGQLAMGVVIDAFGLMQTTPVAVSPMRIVGVLIVALGIVCINHYRHAKQMDSEPPSSVILNSAQSNDREVRATQLGNPGLSASQISSMEETAKAKASRAARPKVGLLFLMALVAGIGSSTQAATNAALATHVGTLEASLISFVGGTLVIFAITLIKIKGRSKPLTHIRPWKFLGGVYGAATVYFVVLATPVLGVGLLMACMMLGQLIGALAVDARGWFEARKIRVDGWRVAGLAIIALGVVLVTAAKLYGI